MNLSIEQSDERKQSGADPKTSTAHPYGRSCDKAANAGNLLEMAAHVSPGGQLHLYASIHPGADQGPVLFHG